MRGGTPPHSMKVETGWHYWARFSTHWRSMPARSAKPGYGNNRDFSHPIDSIRHSERVAINNRPVEQTGANHEVHPIPRFEGAWRLRQSRHPDKLDPQIRPGRVIGNARLWSEDEVDTWIASQPAPGQ